jgi:hypothetical protein
VKWYESQANFLARLPYKLVYDDEKHKYIVDGKPTSSVNQIIDKVFNREYKGDPIYGEIGTAAAKAIELDLREELDETTVDDYVKPRLEAFRKWKKDVNANTKSCEMPLYSDGIAGRLDILMQIDNKDWLIDNKCVKQLNHFTNKVQLSGYWMLVVGNGFVKAPKLAALQLKDDGTYHFEPYEIDADALWRSVWILYQEKMR